MYPSVVSSMRRCRAFLIGSGVAKGIAMAVSVPIVEVPTLDAMAYSLFGAEGVISPIMDARRDQVYNGLFHYEGEKLVSLRENRPMSITELTSELNGMPEAAEKGVIFTGDGVPVFKDVIEETLKVPYTFAPVHVSRQSAGAVGALGKCLFDRGEYVSAAEHRPVYLRKSQAEREKEQRGG